MRVGAQWRPPCRLLQELDQMDAGFHRFSELFAQLGLASDPASIGRFIALHGPLPGGVRL